MELVLDMKDRGDGFLPKGGTPQHQRNLARPHHRAPYDRIFRPQWCDINMGADGVHENMAEFEQAARSVVLPPGPDWKTPKDDPYYIRVRVLVPTGDEAMQNYVMGQEWREMIESFSSMDGALSQTARTDFIDSVFQRFIADTTCAPRPHYAAFSKMTDQARINVYGDSKARNGILYSSPLTAGAPQGWGPSYPWELYNGATNPHRVHPLFFGECCGLQDMGFEYGMPTFCGPNMDGLSPEARTNPYYVAAQIICEPRKIVAADWSHWFVSVGWLMEQRCTVPVLGHNACIETSDYWDQFRNNPGGYSMHYARSKKYMAEYRAKASESMWKLTVKSGSSAKMRTATENLVKGGPPLVAPNSAATGDYISLDALCKQQFMYNVNKGWIDWTDEDDPLVQFVMAVTPSTWPMTKRWEHQVWEVINEPCCITHMTNYVDASYATSTELTIVKPEPRVTEAGRIPADTHVPYGHAGNGPDAGNAQQQQGASAGPDRGRQEDPVRGARHRSASSRSRGAGTGTPHAARSTGYVGQRPQQPSQQQPRPEREPPRYVPQQQQGDDDWGSAKDGSNAKDDGNTDWWKKDSPNWNSGWKNYDTNSSKPNQWADNTNSGYTDWVNHYRGVGTPDEAPTHQQFEKRKAQRELNERQRFATMTGRVPPETMNRLHQISGVSTQGVAPHPFARSYSSGTDGASGYGQKPNVKAPDSTEQFIHATTGGIVSVGSEAERDLAKFLMVLCTLPVSEDEPRDSQLLCPILTLSQRQQVMQLFVENPDNAVFLDNLMKLLPNDPERRILTNRLEHAAMEATERRIPGWLCTSVVPRFDWRPISSHDDISRLYKTDPYRLTRMAYMFHYDEACGQSCLPKNIDPMSMEHGKSFVHEWEIPVFLHAAIMVIHVTGKAALGHVPLVLRTATFKGLFAGIFVSCLPPNCYGFECFPSETAYGVPSGGFLLGFFWRDSSEDQAFRAQVARGGSAGPSVRAWVVSGVEGPYNERTPMSDCRGLGLPGPMAVSVGRVLGNLATDMDWCVNSPIKPASEFHITGTGLVPQGRVCATGNTNLPFTPLWWSLSLGTGEMDVVEPSQHPVLLVKDKTFLRKPGESQAGFGMPPHVKNYAARRQISTKHADGKSGPKEVQKSFQLGLELVDEHGNVPKQMEKELDAYSIYAARPSVMIKEKNSPSFWKNLSKVVKPKVSSSNSQLGAFDLVINSDIKDPTVIRQIEDSLYCNVGVRLDQFRDDEDNAYTCSELFDLATGRSQRDGAFIAVPYEPTSAFEILQGFVGPHQLLTRDSEFPVPLAASSPFPTVGFGIPAPPILFSDLRKEIKSKQPPEPKEILHPVKQTIQRLLGSPARNSGMAFWSVPSGSKFALQMRGKPHLQRLGSGMIDGVLTGATVIHVHHTLQYLEAATEPDKEMDELIAKALRRWEVLMGHPLSLFGIVAVDYCASDEVRNQKGAGRDEERILSALHKTDNAASLMQLFTELDDETRLALREQTKQDGVIGDFDAFVNWEDLKVNPEGKAEYLPEQLAMLGLGLKDVLKGPNGDIDYSAMRGAELRNVKDLIRKKQFSYEYPTLTSKTFLTEVIAFADHILSPERMTFVVDALHPVQIGVLAQRMAPTWYLERLMLTVFATVGPSASLPDYARLNDELKDAGWEDEQMLFTGPSYRSRMDSALESKLTRVFTSPQRTVMITMWEEYQKKVVGYAGNRSALRQGGPMIA